MVGDLSGISVDPDHIYTAMTDGLVVVDGKMVSVKAGDSLPYPYARVIEPTKRRYRRHPKG